MRAVTLLARTALPEKPSEQAFKSEILKIVKQVATELRNTPAVCRKSYINPAVFAAWRSDPTFVINQPAFAGGSVLVAGSDFGTGSSREHAVWALMDYGIKVVISPRFADIFRGNSSKGGLVAAQVSESDVELLWKLLENEPGTQVSVDLKQQLISAGSLVIDFEIDPYTKWRLLEGWDDISLTLRHADEINNFEKSRQPFKPVTTAV